ncbi:hypothetical protein AB4Y96_10880 [Phyllobacterium sp. TAF24]|uniref:hypothetical protein n=1 Tax=unclassified Phyllobacterium TaxID=2638441 RepID=UPI00088B49F0|nr:hypothetical protein [Phyllobacterium sp. OV277]SDP01790.1 hypothetical protein SAMN05443582_103169 [Phyllobacterium sp. OV277]
MRSLFFAVAMVAGLMAADSQAQETPVVNTVAPDASSQTLPRVSNQDAASARLRKNRPAKRSYAREESRRQLTAEYNRRARVFGRASADRWLAIQRQ